MKFILTMICSFYLGNAFAITSFQSTKSFTETSKVIEKFIKDKGLNLFAIIDHAENAKKTEIKLPPNKLFIFGNPKVGTPLMLENAAMGLDLPVKVLIHVNAKNEVIVSYNDPETLAKKHSLNASHPSFLKVNKVLTVLKSKLQ